MKRLETLKKNYEFKYVLNKGRFYRGKFITIYIKENKKQRNLIGIAVSSKNGKAVERNHAKRLIRESYQLIKNNLTQGYDIVFLLNKNTDINKLSFSGIQTEMNSIFVKADLIKKD